MRSDLSWKDNLPSANEFWFDKRGSVFQHDFMERWGGHQEHMGGVPCRRRAQSCSDLASAWIVLGLSRRKLGQRHLLVKPDVY